MNEERRYTQAELKHNSAKKFLSLLKKVREAYFFRSLPADLQEDIQETLKKNLSLFK